MQSPFLFFLHGGFLYMTYICSSAGIFQVINLIHVGKTPGLSLPTINQKNNNHKINMIHKMNRLLSSKGHIFNNIKINEFDSLKRYY